MENTGIVRRIDDLGRIVIPKVFRQQLGIKTSDEFEIFLNTDNTLTVKKIEEEKPNFSITLNEFGQEELKNNQGMVLLVKDKIKPEDIANIFNVNLNYQLTN